MSENDLLSFNDSVRPSIFMMGDRGGEEDEGWQDVGDAPIGVERGQSMGGLVQMW